MVKPASAWRSVNTIMGWRICPLCEAGRDDGLPLACIGMVAHVSQLGILSLRTLAFQAEGSRGQTLGTTAGSADYALWRASSRRRASMRTKVKINIVGPDSGCGC